MLACHYYTLCMVDSGQSYKPITVQNTVFEGVIDFKCASLNIILAVTVFLHLSPVTASCTTEPLALSR